MSTHFWLRHEVKENERRTPILPKHAKQLLDAGFSITVEKSPTRCVPDSEYEALGCKMVDTESWVNAPKDATIVGLKELPETNDPLVHNHVFFAHCYKGQKGADQILNRFKQGGSKLWDLEFLNDDNGRRVAAFGKAAGIAGMAVGLLVWAHRQLNPSGKVPSMTDTFHTYDDLVKYVVGELEKAKAKCGNLPRVIVIGALGRCGGGSSDFAKRCGVEVTRWDLEETKKGGPFVEIIEHDIFLNAIYLTTKIPPFVTKEVLKESESRKLSIIVDVSCDTSNPNNPIPVYNVNTTFVQPTLQILEDTKLPIDVVSIDHLPSMVPYESSLEFGDALIPHLLQFAKTSVWTRAEDLFFQKLKEVLG
eukprot:TRINITY_DN9977_c0_g1_i1.p1 TRINITY_DN9977_c0_g1~~TRINITY_DN9977_c0_g1_i1.p1  ORF type:complete len:374 (-),score=91.69 TRINITY_DN9977_c0_g1_i1:38-1126(-)